MVQAQIEPLANFFLNWRDKDMARDVVPDDMLGVINMQGQGAVEGSFACNLEGRTRHEADAFQVCEKLWILIRDPMDHEGNTRIRIRQWIVGRGRYFAIARWDWVAVGVVGWISQHFLDLIFELFRDVMFEVFGFFVQLFPRVPHHLLEVEFQQAMVTDDLQCNLFARARKCDPFVRLVFNKPHTSKPFHHVCDRGRRDIHRPRNIRGARRFLALQRVNRFEVVFDGLA